MIYRELMFYRHHMLLQISARPQAPTGLLTVLAETGEYLDASFSMLHIPLISISKSKIRQHINLSNNETLHTSYMRREYLSGLSWPSGTNKIDILKAAPVSNSIGHTEFTTFSVPTDPNSSYPISSSLAQSFQRQGDTSHLYVSV